MSVRNVTDATFEAAVLGSDRPVLVDFWADWCPPCRQLAPVLEAVALERGDLGVVSVDADANTATVARFGIRGMPTMVLFNRGVEINRLIGFMPKERLLQELELTLTASKA
jgi:thioredoxin 1